MQTTATKRIMDLIHQKPSTAHEVSTGARLAPAMTLRHLHHLAACGLVQRRGAKYDLGPARRIKT